MKMSCLCTQCCSTCAGQQLSFAAKTSQRLLAQPLHLAPVFMYIYIYKPFPCSYIYIYSFPALLQKFHVWLMLDCYIVKSRLAQRPGRKKPARRRRE